MGDLELNLGVAIMKSGKKKLCGPQEKWQIQIYAVVEDTWCFAEGARNRWRLLDDDHIT